MSMDILNTTIGDFPGGSVVENPPAKQGRQVRFLGQEDPLEEERATLSRTLLLSCFSHV